ncbi:hypothetical protein CIW48_24690 [Methylobacterium sp. P1-11]|nr:hypothetical protein CIW48_24690 [Methylobacterium sp. P1-11]
MPSAECDPDTLSTVALDTKTAQKHGGVIEISASDGDKGSLPGESTSMRQVGDEAASAFAVELRQSRQRPTDDRACFSGSIACAFRGAEVRREDLLHRRSVR